MPRIYVLLLCALTMMSCTDQKDNMVVQGTVKGLKKGTIYFQKAQDTALVTLDSMEINGDPSFKFSTRVSSPEVFYLYLDKNDGNPLNDHLDFFGEAGEITINTSRDYFAPEAEISGSESNKKLQEFRGMMKKFTERNLDLIKAGLEAGKAQDAAASDSIQKAMDANSKRSYLYAVNFVFNNPDSPVTPYIVLTELPELNVKYLDSISGMLTPEVSESFYGVRMKEFIAEVKSLENQEEGQTTP